MNTVSIALRQVSIGYKEKSSSRTVARDIQADLYSGELTCLLGANGVGKSTLLRTLSAFLPKRSGGIAIQGKAIETYSDKELSKVIGVVLTEKIDARDMSVRELIAMGRMPYTGFWGRLTDDDRKAVDDAIRLVRIADLASRSVQTLSDGERQKAMIAKALAQQTPIIILDEPTAFLDYPSKVEIMRLLHRLACEYNKTIFLSTHDLELALQLADRLWLMKRNTPLVIGSPEELSADGSLEEFFVCDGVVFDRSLRSFRIVQE